MPSCGDYLDYYSTMLDVDEITRQRQGVGFPRAFEYLRCVIEESPQFRTRHLRFDENEVVKNSPMQHS